MVNDTTIINRFIAFKNPFRYRSYYYDFETNLYYLNSRYYDPEIGRFINADDIASLNISQIAQNGLNLYAYCLNNPVNQIDENGDLPKWLKRLLKIIAAVFVVVAVSIATAVTAGAFAGLIGISGAIVGAIETGALIGGAVFGSFSIVNQIINVGIDNMNLFSIAVDTFSGAAFGAITAGVGGVGTVSAKVVGGIGKVLLSGLTTTLHQVIAGISKDEAIANIFRSMIQTGLLVSIGAFFGNGNSNSILGRIFTKLGTTVLDKISAKVFLAEFIKGIINIFTYKK